VFLSPAHTVQLSALSSQRCAELAFSPSLSGGERGDGCSRKSSCCRCRACPSSSLSARPCDGTQSRLSSRSERKCENEPFLGLFLLRRRRRSGSTFTWLLTADSLLSSTPTSLRSQRGRARMAFLCSWAVYRPVLLYDARYALALLCLRVSGAEV